MNNSGITKTEYLGKRDILTFTLPKAAIGVIVNGTDVTADDNGVLRIYAGQALQGAEGELYTNRQLVLSLCTGAPEAGNEIYGVTQHDIVFEETTDEMNANCIIFGWVDPQKMDPEVQAIPDEVRAALTGKVTFLDGNCPQA
jgi:hypothetical protein